MTKKLYGTSARERGGFWVLPACGTLLVFSFAVLLQWQLRDMPFDDAFIHLRVAKNLELHGVAVFNLGERVMTTSSPLWTVVLALLGVPTHTWLLPVLEAGLLTASGVLAYVLSRGLLPESWNTLAPRSMHRSRFSSIALAAIAGVLTMLLLLPSSIGQMETPLAMALLLAAVVSFEKGHSAGFPLLALAACTRLELLPLFFVACVTAVCMKLSRSAILVAIGLLAALMGAVYMQFGVLLPNSIRAKAIGYAYHRSDIVRQLFEAHFVRKPLVCCLTVFLGAMLVDQALSLRKHKPPLFEAIPVLAGVWGIAAMSEYVVRNTPVFEWYRPVFLLPLLICLLMYRATPTSPKWLHHTLATTRLVGMALFLLIPLWKGVVTVGAAISETPVAKSVVDRGDSTRVQEYLAVGGTLRMTCPSASMMTAEIGALGWAFDGYVLDAFGIASPRALAFQPLRSGAPVAGIPAAFALEVHPDIIVSYTALDVEVRGNPNLMKEYELLELPPSLRSYRSGTVQSGWHGSTHLDVFLRKQGPCPVALTREALRVATQQGYLSDVVPAGRRRTTAQP